MREATVATNLSCNQNCAYCDARASTDDRRFVHPAAVRARIAAAVDAGAGRVALTGGEPTLRRDLAALVADVRARGAIPVLETNGALIDDTLAAALAAAGLAHARVHLPAWGDDCDAVTRDPGGFVATLAGMKALARAGIAMDVRAPVLRATLGLVRALPARLVEAGIPVETLLIEVPLATPDAAALPSPEDTVSEIEAIESAGRQSGVTTQLDAKSFIPPCLFPRPDRVAHLYALGRGSRQRPGYRQVPGCAGCVAADRCPGLPDVWQSRVDVRPLPDDRTRRRLTVIGSTREQIARELVTHEQSRGAAGEVVDAVAVRINFHCNQSCAFCFVSTHLPPASDASIRSAITAAGRAGAALIISGGEPTLNASLLDFVKLGRASGVRGIELQTNAIRLATGTLARDLADAGVETALVSLHGSTAEISDAITDAPGTFARTVVGLDRLAETPIQVRLNFVACALNREDFPRYIEMVATRWPGFTVTLSFVGSHTDVVPRTAALIPRYSDFLPSLLEGLAVAKQRGVQVTGFDSMCGLPLCLVPDAAVRFEHLAEYASGSDAGEFLKPDVCKRCALTTRCFGVRRGYAELHGTSELRAVSF